MNENQPQFCAYAPTSLKIWPTRLDPVTLSLKNPHSSLVQTGMRSYFNGGGTPSSASATPPPSLSAGAGGAARRSSSYVPGGGRSSSASLPRSPDNDFQPSVALSAHSGHSGSGGGGGQDVYVNIYQNTNHPSLFVSVHLVEAGPYPCHVQPPVDGVGWVGVSVLQLSSDQLSLALCMTKHSDYWSL